MVDVHVSSLSLDGIPDGVLMTVAVLVGSYVHFLAKYQTLVNIQYVCNKLGLYFGHT